MSMMTPFDILADFPGWTTEFDLLYRQEQSRTARGQTIVKDFGTPLWRMSAQSHALNPNELDHWRARLNAMENGLQLFMGYPMSRCYPIAYPRGTWPTGSLFDGDGTLDDIGLDNKSVKVGGLPTEFVISVGDYLAIDGNLHQVMELAIAGALGVTPLFEVRPHIQPGVMAGGSPATVVSLKRPWCLMAIVPGSISSGADAQTGRGAVSFQATEARI